MNLMRLLLVPVALAALAPAQTLDSRANNWNRIVETGLMTVPTSSADVATVDLQLRQITITNRSASTVTVTICDKQATPKCVIDTGTSIAAGSHLVAVYPEGLLFKGGLSWVASAASVEGSIVARKQ